MPLIRLGDAFFFLLGTSADVCCCTVGTYRYGSSVKIHASVYIDNLQRHSTLEYYERWMSVNAQVKQVYKPTDIKFKNNASSNVLTAACACLQKKTIAQKVKQNALLRNALFIDEVERQGIPKAN